MAPAMAPVSPRMADLENHWWELRVIVLVSLFLQNFLLFSGPLRKRTSKGYIIIPIWISYLLSTILPIYGLTKVETIMENASKETTISSMHPHHSFITLWSSFLFLHLAQPDTITAFSLEENQLWIRKLFNLCLCVYTIRMGFQMFKNGYPFAVAWLVYIAGVYRNCDDIITCNCSPMVAGHRISYLRCSLTLDNISDDLIDLKVLEAALVLYYKFRNLIVGFGFTYQSCTIIRNIFLKLTAKDAFRIVERELNCFYEELYTKAWWTYNLRSCVYRLGEYVSLWVALVIFCFVENGKFDTIDVSITYLLLLGSIFRETMTFFIVLCSDWSIAFVCGSRLKDVALWLTRVTTSSPWLQKKVNRKWSNSLSQYNLISYSQGPSVVNFGIEVAQSISDIGYTCAVPVLSCFKLIVGILSVETVEFSEDTRDFIFEQLKMKSSLANNESKARELQSVRGEWILSRDESCSHLLPWINDFKFDECLLMWHIATELCFHTDSGRPNGNEDNDPEIAARDGNYDRNLIRVRDLSKCLSDYMIYLVIWQPAIMSPVAAEWKETFWSATTDINQILRKENIKTKEDKLEACEIILSSYQAIMPENRGETLLGHALDLARKLKDLEGIRKWEVLSKVWVEMLCYAASRGPSSAHLSQLTRGGQLITFVWLLMYHFGLVN